MVARHSLVQVVFAGSALLAWLAPFAHLVHSEEPKPEAAAAAEKTDAVQPAEAGDAPVPVTVDVARDRAKLLHEVYTSTLLVMHDRYFHDARAIVPARALEDVFRDVNRQTKVDARWISVNTKAMSLKHEPKTEFEKHAAAEIAAGRLTVERIDQGTYQRATAILLAADCISCHTGFFAKEPKGPRYAALIISLPVNEK